VKTTQSTTYDAADHSFSIKSAKEFIPLFVIPNCATRFCFIVRWNQPDDKHAGLDLYANLQPPTEI
jgi:hypothetical protein